MTVPKSEEKSEYLMLSSKNVYDDQITFEDPRYLSEEQFVSENRRTDIKPGDVLMTIVGTVGRTAVVKEGTQPITLQRSVAVLHPNTDICCSRYLMYLLRSKRSFFEAEAHGVAQKGIYLKQLSDVKVAIPEIKKQHEIVTILDKICEVIHAREAEMVALDDLIKARFVEMFGDPEINPKGYKKETLNKHADVVVGYPFKSEGYTETGIKIVGGYNLMQGYIVWDECKHWPALLGYEQYLLQNGDIVIAMDRPWVNGGFKIATIDEEHLPALLIQRTACIRVNDVEQEFLYELLNSNRFAEHCNITGSLVPHISNKDINSYEIILSPIAEQKVFSEFVQQVDKSKAAVQKSLDEAQVLFDSLMQEYFG